MYWHILLTEKCNSECKYCYEKSMKEFDNGLDKKFKFDFSEPCSSEINLDKLKKFISQDKSPVIVFYGGEPLLNISKIKEIINGLGSSVRYCMQTNGKLLNELPKEYMDKFSRILVSIDGNKERTDFNRGTGTYDKVIENIELIKENGFKGEIVARMTISQDFSDLYEQVRNILSIQLFNSVHWQLDMGFYKNDFEEKKISKFVSDYNKSLTKLINFWADNIELGKVLKLYPFLGFFESIYSNKPVEGIRCGAGFKGYAITTSGKIAACPIMNNIQDFNCGNLDSKLDDLKKINIIEPCKSCKDLGICGGRCLYMNYAKLWDENAQKYICLTIRHLISEIKRIMPWIKESIDDCSVTKKDFEYEQYFGPEITP